MSLLSKIKAIFGRQRPVEPPDDRGDGVSRHERSAAPAAEHSCEPSRHHLDLRNAIARGAASGTAREVVRKILDGMFPG